jgi:hypothetical protein
MDVPAGPDLDRYTDQQVVDEAKALVAQLKFPNDQARELIEELEHLLTNVDFRREIEQHGISGVCVYSGGSGGLIITGGGADGLASFCGGRRAVPFEATAVGIGAMAGGQGRWGVGLMLGLDHEAWFPGEYDGTTVSATAVETSVAGGRLKSEWHDHTVRTVAVGAGLAATAGHVEITVSWAE